LYGVYTFFSLSVSYVLFFYTLSHTVVYKESRQLSGTLIIGLAGFSVRGSNTSGPGWV
jgi:hypothetical protein